MLKKHIFKVIYRNPFDVYWISFSFPSLDVDFFPSKFFYVKSGRRQSDPLDLVMVEAFYLHTDLGDNPESLVNL